MSELWTLGIREIVDGLCDRSFCAREVLEATLDRAERVEPTVKAFVDVFGEQARRDADDADRAGPPTRDHPLRGVPVAVKDVFDVAGHVTAAGSRILSDNLAHDDAAAVRRLRKAGAVIIGKTTTHEFAFGTQTPPTRNPWNTRLIPGGSSGGSAVAVAVGASAGALGSDTVGSVRVPSSFCGVVGLKPTHGLLSVAGMVPLTRTMDVVGPMARTVADCRLLFDALRGERSEPSPGRRDSGAGKVGVVGVMTESMALLDAGVRATVGTVLDRLAEYADLVEVSVGGVARWNSAAHAILGYEAGRYHEAWLGSLPYLYTADVRERLRTGSSVTAQTYAEALTERRALQRRLNDAFGIVDVLLTPSVMAPPPAQGKARERVVDGTTVSRGRSLTSLLAPFSVAGVPAVSLPVGLDGAGLPVGVQLAAAAGRDAELLAWSRWLHDVLDWQPRFPPAPQRSHRNVRHAER